MLSKILFYFFRKKVTVKATNNSITMEDIRSEIEKAKLEKLKPKVDANENSLISMLHKNANLISIFKSFKAYLSIERLFKSHNSTRNAA